MEELPHSIEWQATDFNGGGFLDTSGGSTDNNRYLEFDKLRMDAS
jgi:hypothetical protein